MSENGERTFTFVLFGQEFSVATTTPEEEMNEVVRLITEVQEQESSDGGWRQMPRGKQMLLTCLTLASQYQAMRKEYLEYQKENNERICKLAAQIRQDLADEKRNPDL